MENSKEMTNTLNNMLNSEFIRNLNAVSPIDAFVSLIFAIVIGIFIMQVYKKTFKGVMYSKSFGTSLIAMTLVSTFVLLAVTSNVVLSLGMVGALSIVRFRSAVKEPIDIAYLFWAIGEGIVLGAGLIPLAVLGAVVIGIVMIIFTNKDTVANPYILVVNYDYKVEEKIFDVMKNRVKKYSVKSKSVSSSTGAEMTIEVRMKDVKAVFINEIADIEGVKHASLVSYNGDYMS